MPQALTFIHVSMSLCIIGFLGLAGCGYRFMVEGPGPMLGQSTAVQPEGPPLRLAIHTLDNRTFESNLELKYTDYLKSALKASGIAKIVQHERDADFILTGAIESVSLPSLTFTPDQTRESRVIVSVKVQIKDRETGAIRWTQTLQSSAEFFVGAAPQVGGATSGLQFNRVLQDRALEQAGQLLAEDLSDRLLLAREQGVFSSPASEPSERISQS